LRLAESGDIRQALTVCREGIAVRRELAESDVQLHGAGLATSILQLAILLHDYGNPVDAISAARESVELFRQLDDVVAQDLTSDRRLVEDLYGAMIEEPDLE
jgi:hypothetical protein